VLDESPAPSGGTELGVAPMVRPPAATVAFVGATGYERADAAIALPASAPARRWWLAGHVAPGSDDRAPSAAGALVAYERVARDGGVSAMVALGLTSSSVELAGAAPTIRTLELPVRAGAWLGDRYAVGVAAIGAPYVTRGGTGDRNVVFGAGFMARAQVSVGAGLGLVAMVGVDGMARAVEYRWNDETVSTSGRVRPWLAIGASWGAP